MASDGESEDEGDHFESLTVDLEPCVCEHSVLKFGRVGYNGPAGFMWDFDYVYDKLKRVGKTKQKYKIAQELQTLCGEEQRLPRADLHVKARKRPGDVLLFDDLT